MKGSFCSAAESFSHKCVCLLFPGFPSHLGIRAQCFQHRRSHVTSFLGYLFNDSHPLLVAVCSWRHYLPRTLVCPICEPGLLLWPEKDLGVVKVLEVVCHHICYKCACNYTCNVFAANSLQNDSLYRCPSWYSYSCELPEVTSTFRVNPGFTAATIERTHSRSLLLPGRER